MVHRKSFERARFGSWSLCTAVLVATVGCGDGGSAAAGPGGDGGGDGSLDLENRAGLRKLGDADLFFDELRAALVAQRGESVIYLEEGADGGFAVGDTGSDVGAPTADNGGTGGGTTGGTTDSAQGADASSGESAVAAGDVSGTNVQEIGVDEQDRVKTDGRYLYVLEQGVASYPIDGEPLPVDLPVSIDGAGDSFPYVPPRTALRVLSLDPAVPDATPVTDVTLDLGGRSAGGLYLSGGLDDPDARKSAIVTASGGGYWGIWNDSYAFGGLDTLVLRVDLADPAVARMDRQLLIQGQAVSSRRIGRHLFLASRFYPRLPGVEPWAQSAAQWEASVAAATDASLLPSWTSADGSTIPLIDPAECFVAGRPAGASWYSPDIVTLSVIDLDTLEPVDSECFLGSTETLYASPDAVFLATTRWNYGFGALDDNGATVDIENGLGVAGVYYVDPRIDTDIHRFDIDGGSLAYTGSGSVQGHLGWNEERKPYRMSEQDGYLRVATFAERQGPDLSPIILSVLAPGADGRLERIAELPNERHPEPIGKPGEQLYASRFLGDRAYLVTFRQTDPLYVVDLADPRDPRLAGELEIAGYSDWLLPIGERHVLGIGKDAVPVPVRGFGDGRGALQQGLKLALFDVADPTAPKEVNSIVVGQRGTESVALYNPRAITLQAETATHPARIALGIDVYGDPDPVSPPSIDDAWNYQPWRYTGLHGFEVRTGADAGIEKTGVLVVESSNGEYYAYPRYGDDRAVLVGDAAYYVHGADVYAAPWNDFGNSLGPR